jgi:hypothetical protein
MAQARVFAQQLSLTCPKSPRQRSLHPEKRNAWIIFSNPREGKIRNLAQSVTVICLSSADLPISFDDAIKVVLREMERRGIAETHRVAALHGFPDSTAEGAMFAATIFPRGRAVTSGGCKDGPRFKLLIQLDGRLAVRAWRPRNAAGK